MMFKKKCPVCGAKNSKERMVCIECGAPLTSEPVKMPFTRVSTEAETQVRTEVEKAPKEKVEAEYRDNEKVLYRTIEQPIAHKKSAWFWVGVALLSLSALFWLMVIPIIVSTGDGVGVLIVLIFTAIPIGIGIYCVRRGRKARAVEVGVGSKPTYPSQPSVTPTQETQRTLESTYTAQPAAKPAQRIPLGFVSTLKERLRDKTRDRLCAGLCAIGLGARMAERGRPEEKIGGKGSFGLIDIPEGPIRWVNMRKETHGGGQGGSITYYYTEYGVPDSRLAPNSPRMRIKSVRKKIFPLVGPVRDLHWQGWDFGLGIITRLNSDFQLKQPIMRSRDVTITAISDYSCWIISTKTRDIPSRELWNCYQTIAQHLLAEWSPGK